MKSLKLKKLVAVALVAMAITTISPVGASAAWKQDSNGWWNTEGNSWSTGWRSIDNNWYYFGSDGYMKTNWVNDAGTWYYMQPSGEMKTGWVNDNGTWYYLQSSGAMKTGWINDNGTWYFAAQSGAMQTGVVKVDGKVYYLAPSGAMAIGTVTINGVAYTFDINGAAVGDKLPIVDKAFNGNGSTATVSKPTNTDSNTDEEDAIVHNSSSGGGSGSMSPLVLNKVGTHVGNSTITTTGTFGPASGTSTVQGNVVISNANAISGNTVTLQNLNITGTLTINFGEGNVILDNVVVNGVNVSNIGANSLHVRGNSKIKTLKVNDTNNNAHIVVEGNAAIADTTILAGATLEVDEHATNANPFTNITLSPAAANNQITFTGNLSTAAVVVIRPSSNVVIATGATLQSITANATLGVSGAGSINRVVVASAGAGITLGGATIGTVDVNSVATGAILNITTIVTNLNISAPNTSIQGNGTIVTANIGASGITIAFVPIRVTVLSSAHVTGLTVGGTPNYQNSANVTVIDSMPTSVSSGFQSEIEGKYAKYALLNPIIPQSTTGSAVSFEVGFRNTVDSSVGGKVDYVTQDVLVTNETGTDVGITKNNDLYTAPVGSIVYSTVRVYRSGQIGYVTIPYVVV